MFGFCRDSVTYYLGGFSDWQHQARRERERERERERVVHSYKPSSAPRLNASRNFQKPGELRDIGFFRKFASTRKFHANCPYTGSTPLVPESRTARCSFRRWQSANFDSCDSCVKVTLLWWRPCLVCSLCGRMFFDVFVFFPFLWRKVRPRVHRDCSQWNVQWSNVTGDQLRNNCSSFLFRENLQVRRVR